MRILILSDYFSTWNIGGASRVLASQLKVLENDSDFNVKLLSGYPGDSSKENHAFNWVHFCYKRNGYLGNLWASLRAMAREENFDILHIHQPLIGLLAHLSMPKDCVRLYHFHSFWEDEKLIHAGASLPKRWLSHFKGCLESWVLSKMDHFVVLSDYSKQRLLKRFPDAVVTQIPGSVNFRSEEVRRSVDSDDLKLLSVRRLEPRMGLDLLIQAIAKLKAEGVKVYLNIVGRGREREALEKLIERLGLGDQVKLLGRLSESELEEQMRTHHGMVLPTRELEGFGMSVIEAFEAGLPVLATKVAALSEFEKHKGAFYGIETPEIEAIAKGIRNVRGDWEKIEERTKACRQVAETYYSHEIMREKLIGLYRDLT